MQPSVIIEDKSVELVPYMSKSVCC